MTYLLVIFAVFTGVASLVGGVAIMIRGADENSVEERLDFLTGVVSASKKGAGHSESSLLSHSLDFDRVNFLEEFVSKFLNLRRLLEQADIGFSPPQFFLVCGGLCAAGSLIAFFSALPLLFVPLAGIALGAAPLGWAWYKRRSRFAAFQKQLPEALELIARALRAGHSLGAGFKLVADEMSPPIATEIGRVYEEQNLGISLDDALDDLVCRIPNLDLRFFATAVILQRQTGGDLAEILDKIGHLVRERFKIWGAIQALTGEGRISGIVLLSLPPVLFLAIYRLNPQYIGILFTDPLGKQLIAVAVFLQILGALVIKKIINIKV